MADLSKDETLTKKDFVNFKKELLDILPTKNELKQELSQYITKDDLKKELAQFVTKTEFRQELAKVATKEAVEVVARQVLKNTTDIVEIKAKLNDIDWKIEDIREDIKNKFDVIIISLDKLSGEISNNRTEKAAIDHALMRHEERFEKHETRISQLERKCA
jgi:chromosome segregation ATPase